MDIKKYGELRKKIKDKNFEGKNKDVDRWLFAFSYIGNIGSIFFAFFLVYPAFLKAISANLISGDLSMYIAGFCTVLVLGIFELIKRKLLANLSFDLIRNKFKVNKAVVGWFVFSMALIAASFYFSLNGAMNFASTSKNKNDAIETSINAEIDSVKLLYEEKKKPYLADNESLRESNIEYREKIAETPLNYRTVRKELQDLVDANLKTIESNKNEITDLNNERDSIINELQEEEKNKITENQQEDYGNIFLFLIISSSIEIIIIIGVYFREYYGYQVYLTNEAELEADYKKIERYKTLLAFVYKNGQLGMEEKIMGVSKLQQIVSEKSHIANSNKFVRDFIDDMTYLGVFKLHGTRRYTAVSFDEAQKKVEDFDDTLRLLEKLK